MRLASEPACLPVGVLRRPEVADKTPDLTFPIPGVTGRRVVLTLQAALCSPPCLLERLEPRTAELHDLGAMDETATRERHEVGLTLAPAGQSSRPLAGTA